jgi:hypothetical protein
MSNSAQTASNLNHSLFIRVSPKKIQFYLYPESGGLQGAFDMTTLSPFARRKNSDGSIDSICTTCFQTIASEDSEGKLIAHEEHHSCDPYWLLFRTPFDSRQSTSAPLSQGNSSNR